MDDIQYTSRLSLVSTNTKRIEMANTINETRKTPKGVSPVMISAYFIPVTKKTTAQIPANKK